MMHEIDVPLGAKPKGSAKILRWICICVFWAIETSSVSFSLIFSPYIQMKYPDLRRFLATNASSSTDASTIIQTRHQKPRSPSSSDLFKGWRGQNLWTATTENLLARTPNTRTTTTSRQSRGPTIREPKAANS
ncbi:hypothetical protein FB451DRAFT_1193578 [Mycena latifolia]|nr:hypothetical protein FB451DRAFT_1193578 [Mycena latifolia]